MDVVSARVLGTIALVLGLCFLVLSGIRLTRPDLDVVVVILNAAVGVLWIVGGTKLWRYARRKAQRDD